MEDLSTYRGGLKIVGSVAALGQLRASIHVDDADAAGLSALVDAHVNMLGHHAFTQPTGTGLRPLRELNEPTRRADR
jgi:hypothetical protein